MQKRRLEAIPEDDEATGSRRPKVEAEDVSPAQGASGGGLSQEMVHLGRGRRSDSDSDSDEQLRDVFKKLNLTPEHEMFIASPDSSEDEERYQRLMDKQITLKDTALGRQQEAFKKQFAIIS